MADRYCGNCGQELGTGNRFCPGCGRPIHETAVVPTPEADVPVPPLPVTEAEDRTGSGGGVSTTFVALGITVLIFALLGALASGSGGAATVVLIILAVVLLGVRTRRMEGAKDRGPLRPGADQPVPEAERPRILEEEMGTFVNRGYLVQYRTPTTAQLFRHKHFSFVWALLWFLVFGIGIVVYLIYYAAKRDDNVYLRVDEYGAVRATWQ